MFFLVNLKFVNKTMNPSFIMRQFNLGGLLVLLANIRLARINLLRTKALAYFGAASLPNKYIL